MRSLRSLCVGLILGLSTATVVGQVAGQTYSYTDSDSAERKRPAPKQLALMSFKLAEAFQQADAEVNATALAIERARNTFKAEDLDLASLHQPKS